jgi:ABC-type phosphate/phosphonate transport system substrate-binding protein
MKMKGFLTVLVLFSGFFFLPAHSQTIPSVDPGTSYTVAVMTKSYDERRTKALEKFEEILVKYVEERSKLKIRLKALTYPDLVKTVEKGGADVVWGYGLVVSMELLKKLPIVPIVAPTLGEEKRNLYKRFIVTSKSTVKGIADFKGKRLTHVGDEQWSFELLLFKIWAAEKLGVKEIHQFFDMKGKQPDEGYFIPASKRGAIYSLFINEADLAVAHEFEYITQEKLTPNAIREKTEILPLPTPPESYLEAPVFVRKGLSSSIVDRLMKVMMEMPDDPEGKQILLSSKISGFIKVSEQDYQPVKALIAKKEMLGIK